VCKTSVAHAGVLLRRARRCVVLGLARSDEAKTAVSASRGHEARSASPLTAAETQSHGCSAGARRADSVNSWTASAHGAGAAEDSTQAAEGQQPQAAARRSD
jgi:hypothetical protein